MSSSFTSAGCGLAYTCKQLHLHSFIFHTNSSLSTGYFLGAFLGPVMSGSIAGHHGWKSFFWLETGLSAFAIFLIAFTFPETKYHRKNRANLITTNLSST